MAVAAIAPGDEAEKRRRFIVSGMLLCGLFGAWAETRAAEPPASRRSTEAIRRVAPQLKTALAEKHLSWGAPLFIRIFKKENELEVWLRGADGRYVLFRTYPVCFYSGALGPKLRVGDSQAPEGFYRVTPRQMNPFSSYHLSFDLGYPNAYDRAHRRTGSALMVHGSCVSIGCYAMKDGPIEEIYALADAALRNGQAAFDVQALPFRLTDAALAPYKDQQWYDFWAELKAGYDAFEKTHVPPTIVVRNRHYVVQ